MSNTYTQTVGGGTITAANNQYKDVALAATTQFNWPSFNYNETDVIADIMRVTPGTSGLSLYLPDARLVGVGTTIMFINPGADTFTVKDYGGANTVSSIPTTQAIYVILRDNSTQVGTWTAIQFAVGSSAVTAAALAGLGLTAIGSTLNVNWPRSDKSSTPYTVDATTDRATLLNWTGGVGTFDLPAVAAGNTGFFFGVKNSGSGALTITPNGADTIDGGTGFTVDVGESFLVISAGSAQWLTIGNQLLFTATYIQIDISGSGDYTVPAAQQGYLIYDFIGTLTGDRTIKFPAAVNQFYVHNGVSGAFTLSIGTTAAAGVTAAIVSTDRVVAYSDGTNVYAIIESTIDLSAFNALAGTRTDVSTGTQAMTANRRYRGTGACTLTLASMTANQFNIVEFGAADGTTITVGRNSQTIDGVAENNTCNIFGPIVLYYCNSVGAVVTKLIGSLPS